MMTTRDEIRAARGGTASPTEGSRTTRTSSAKAIRNEQDLMGALAEFGNWAKSTLGGGAAGFVEGASAGSGGAALSGMTAAAQKPGVPPMMAPMAGAVNAISNIATGGQSPLLDSEAEQGMIDQAMTNAPTAGTIGNLMGEAGAMAAGGHVAALPKVGTKAALNMASRVGQAGVGGGAYGGAVSSSKGESPAEGALYGALMGAAGQTVVAEFLPAVLKTLRDSGASDRAVSAIKNMYENKSGQPFDPVAVQKRLSDLGEGAVLADLPELQPLAKAIMYDPKLVKDVKDLSLVMHQRVGDSMNPKKAVINQFRLDARDTLADTFKDAASIASEPRARHNVFKDIDAQRKALQPQYNQVWDKYSGVKFKPQYFQDAGEDAILMGEQTSTDAAHELNTWFKDRVARMDADEGGITPQGVQTLREEVKKKIGAVKKDDMKMAKRLAGLKDFLTDDVLGQIPEYKALNASYKDTVDYMSAYDSGAKVFDMKPDALEQAVDELGLMDAADRAGFLEGFSRGMINKLDDARKSGTAINKITGSDSFQQALSTVMGPDEAKAFTNSANAALLKQSSATSLIGGADKAGVRAEALVDDPTSKFKIGVVLGGILNKIKPSWGTSSAASLGAASSLLQNTGFGAKQGRALSETLAQGGDDAGGSLLDIAAGRRPSSISKESMLDQALSSGQLNNPAIGAAIGGGSVGQYEQGPARRERRQRRRRASAPAN